MNEFALVTFFPKVQLLYFLNEIASCLEFECLLDLKMILFSA